MKTDLLTKKTLSLLVGLSSAVATYAQSSGQYDLSWPTIDGGGGVSAGGQFTLQGTAGQLDAGAVLSGGHFNLTGGFWSLLSVIQTPGAPLLNIMLLDNGMALVSWPLSVSGFTLEETINLSGGSWSATPQAVVDTVSEHTVTVPASGPMKVFRLRK